MNAAIDAATVKKTAGEWVDILNAAGVPAGPIYKLDQMFADPQVKETGIVQTIAHPELGDIEILGQPIGLGRTPPSFRSAPPRLGEHTDAVLAEAGYTPERVAELRSQGVI
jgi:crotonobetainyl-CoA:carnitine CoA-transferase CaiB-like acyl-CoA transferase